MKLFFPARLVAALVVVFLVSPRANPDDKDGEEKPAKSSPPPPGAVEVRMADDSTLKLTLRDERVEMTTRFGKLLIPVAEINKIEFGRRLSDDEVKKIADAVADLGSPEFRKRESASASLLGLREKAYPFLLRAARDKDAEVRRRASGLVETIAELVPEEKLRVRPEDVIYTSDDAKIVGRIAAASFKVQTVQFGEQQLRLADLRGLHSLAYVEPEAEASADVAADPGLMQQYIGQAGKTFRFRVTGAAPGARVVVGGIGPGGGAVMMAPGGHIWGTDVYTLDSALAVAAVHAGALKPGQTGVVKVAILGPQAAFQGSTRNGVASNPFGPFPGAFQFVKK